MHLERHPKREKSNIRQLRTHYEIEKELASRLRNASKEQRKTLYSSVYNELYRKIPYHSQILRKHNQKAQRKNTLKQLQILKTFLTNNSTFLELGAGDCHLSFEICKYVRKVYAIDVSDRITRNTESPKNFELILSDGISVNVPFQSINVAYSNQLMEHLHPEDAMDQLREIYQALAPGGIYICITPHRFMGPVDISKHFDHVATGLHLKEYTNSELYQLFKKVGFPTIQSLRRIGRTYTRFAIYPAILLEYFLNPMPYALKKKLCTVLFIRHLLSIRLIATKSL